MGDAYRIATKVPWEESPRDWSKKFRTLDGVLDELENRAERHKGKSFDERVRGSQEGWGNDRNLKMTIVATRGNLSDGVFGTVAQVRALSDQVQWWIRKLKTEDEPIQRPEANTHVDWMYTYVFRDQRSKYPGVENWGTCNRRYIAGSSTWSQHAPWLSPNPGCNAIDYHAGYDMMYKLSRDLPTHPQHVAKVLFYGHEWTQPTGWLYVPSVGHYDHVHAEGPRDHGGLAGGCNY